MAEDQVVESWRPARRGAGLDLVKRMGWAAAGLMVLLAAGAGGYALIGRAPRGVPVIEADSRPVRVRPDNPGGMQVAGAEEQIMGGTGGGQADALAPAPEVPAPQLLRAQVRGVPAGPAPLPAPPLPAQAVSLAMPAPAAAGPVSALPETRPLPPVRVPLAPPKVAAVPEAGTQVQLAALDSEQAARAEWQRLAKRMPDLLASRAPAVLRADRDGHAVWRLRMGGFADVAQATAFCTQVKAKGAGCSIASF